MIELNKTKKISRSEIEGNIKASPSKSSMIRQLFAAFLFTENAVINNPCYSDDCLAAIDVLEKLGAKFTKEENRIVYHGKEIPAENEIELNCGESAFLFRMLAAITPVINKKFVLMGRGSLLKRDMSDIDSNLSEVKISHSSNDGFLPYEIQGTYFCNELNINAGKSSQFLSGLLYALPFLDTNTVIKAEDLNSRYYVDLTIDVLKKFEININNRDYRSFTLTDTKEIESIETGCEADWSGAAFMLVAGACSGKVRVRGLDMNSMQGDKKIIDVLKEAGAEVKINDDEIAVVKAELKAFRYDATDTPDMIPALVALAVNCSGESRIKGIKRLKHKESDRLNALLQEYSKLGADIRAEGNEFLINKSEIKGGNVSSHNDHRITMSLAVAGTFSQEPVIIDDVDCIKKSYPKFVEDLIEIGGKVE